MKDPTCLYGVFRAFEGCLPEDVVMEATRFPEVFEKRVNDAFTAASRGGFPVDCLKRFEETARRGSFDMEAARRVVRWFTDFDARNDKPILLACGPTGRGKTVAATVGAFLAYVCDGSGCLAWDRMRLLDARSVASRYRDRDRDTRIVWCARDTPEDDGTETLRLIDDGEICEERDGLFPVVLDEVDKAGWGRTMLQSLLWRIDGAIRGFDHDSDFPEKTPLVFVTQNEGGLAGLAGALTPNSGTDDACGLAISSIARRVQDFGVVVEFK